MKIGIITFHFASNQGAVLQCYALQKYLSKSGHEVSIINYRPAYHTIRYKAHKNPFLYAKGFWRMFYNKKPLRRIYLTVRSFARCLYMNIRQTDSGVEKCFDAFRKRHLNMTREYTSLSQLKKDPPDFDAYISGSDQLWNPEILDQDFDEAYFLRFGNEKTIRISYAISIGKDMPEQYLSRLNELSDCLDAVSLREYNSGVSAALNKDIHVCIDPTFLLESEDYQSVESNDTEQSPYIFVYGFETNDLIIKAIETAKAKYNCRVINGSPMRIKYDGADFKTREYGPDKFLSYIKNASCVVTNSFHATAFSIIYKKRFITVPHTTRGLRMQSLLGKLGLKACLYGDEQFNLDEAIDYDQVYNQLNQWRYHSEAFLRLSLSGKKNHEIPFSEDEKSEF